MQAYLQCEGFHYKYNKQKELIYSSVSDYFYDKEGKESIKRLNVLFNDSNIQYAKAQEANTQTKASFMRQWVFRIKAHQLGLLFSYLQH